ncbi:hypothetical protein ACQPZA_00775 [Pseudonocardia xinjiangensis]|uniref:hypothetical protein n=1 Tax=Pseudonocardia xinjiangensis TaxID=75289 RepID=UPI003D93042B
MDAAWIGLVGAVAGAGIALLGQYIVARTGRREREIALLLDQCAYIIAFSEDFRNRVWEERRLDREGRVAEWDIGAYRIAEAKLLILNTGKSFGEAIGELRKRGADLGVAWRTERADNEKIEAAWWAHHRALKAFTEASATLVKRRR